MFYSNSLLARKGPLGTVWFAAHRQGKLKKSNYITVNIPSTVEQIMNPQIPIALRLSSHLLYGVVRIYSKKVEYLQHDYNVLSIDISKAYSNADINLPEDANQARFESITLPDNFALDLMNIDDNNLNMLPDSHIRPNEDISFTDHSPVSFSKSPHGTPAGYIMIYVDEDASRNPSISRGTPGPRSGQRHMEENSHPQTPPSTIHGVEDSGPNVSPPETFRLNNSNLRKTPISLALPDEVEPDLEMVNEILETNNIPSPKFNDIPDNGPSSPPKQNSSQEFGHFEQDSFQDNSKHDSAQDNSGSHILFEMAPSSPRLKRHSEQALPQPRAKRAKRIKYDEATVLTNEFMKKSIDDPSGLKRKRRVVHSFLCVHKLNNALKKEKVLFDPVITGVCDNLYQSLEDDNVPSKAHLINIEQADPEPEPEPEPEPVEIGRFNNFDDVIDNMIPISPSDNIPFSSPRTLNENTPFYDTDVGSKSYQAQTTKGTDIGPTPDPASSIGTFNSDMETPFFDSNQGFDNSGGLYNIAEDDDEELAFMEDDNGTPGLVGTPDVGSLLPRTRSLAKLIKEKSAATPSSSEKFGPVSMKSILQGRTRKICSRMFFETLVLKSCQLINVKQDQPYDDITLEVTPKLSKLDLSAVNQL